jgi:3-methyladenine DNA glycosylase AlkD
LKVPCEYTNDEKIKQKIKKKREIIIFLWAENFIPQKYKGLFIGFQISKNEYLQIVKKVSWTKKQRAK